MMQRTLGDDLTVATAIMLGAPLACLLGHAKWTVLASGFVAIVVATAALNLVLHASPGGVVVHTPRLATDAENSIVAIACANTGSEGAVTLDGSLVVASARSGSADGDARHSRGSKARRVESCPRNYVVLGMLCVRRTRTLRAWLTTGRSLSISPLG